MQKSFRQIRHQLQSKTWITVLESLIEDGVDFVVDVNSENAMGSPRRLREGIMGNIPQSDEHKPATGSQIKNFFKNHKSKTHPSGVKVKVQKIRSRGQGDYYRASVVNPGDTIPNVLRKIAMEKILGGNPSDWSNINYGNIKSNMMTLGEYQWTALFWE